MAKIEKFIEHLSKLKDDRGIMADLKRGFSETTEHRAYPHIAIWCDITNNRERKIFLLIAAGFAVHKKSVTFGNMGTVLKKIAVGDGRGNDGLKTFEARFRRLISCDTAEEVCERLPGIIKIAEKKGIAVNFVQLFNDLQYWNNNKKIQWAAEYWSSKKKEEE